MKRFEITYSDGKIFSGETLSDWNSCPPNRVQNVTVLEDDDSAQTRIYGHDYYILDDDNQVIGTDVLIPGSVKEGEQLEQALFFKLRNSVFEGGPPTPPGRGPSGHSRIWNRYDDTPWEVGVRQGVRVNE